ncbi:histone acetyltransferase HAC2-like [Raphanus sativus]|uniref:histone acetyltransferase n=1 Tax=Raphanus sativus TaxID=3726 RepID=A0A6J0K7D0_RAPSA|nr:histone acetyltransferase HAC2-like [Raphanus sativus]
MPESHKGVMRPNLNTMPNQQLSIQSDANVNKECLGSKRSNYHIIVPDDDEEEDVVFLRETLPSKRQRVEAHPPLKDDETTLGSGMEVAEPMESDEQSKPEANTPADTTVPLEKKRDVSLVERFTEEEIEMHIKSLHEGKVELKDGETCQLCGESQLLFPAAPLYCSICTFRIKDDSPYYIPGETISGAQHQICNRCYVRRRRKKFTLSGVDIVKANMLKYHNNADNQDSEHWVVCESCGKWQHQICGLYNPDKDIGQTSDYICPHCLLEERRSNNNMGVYDNTDLGAEDLPETILSHFIERRLTRRLKEERHQTAEATGKSIDDVSVPDDLTLRVVFSADKSSHVDKTFVDFLHNEHYPSEFPYRSKVILLFQKVDGVDVCIFALIVQEFGSECSQPNKRNVYIGYLDSVKYFRPERVTFSGEALRTFVFHEILIGYLEYCKIRGFTTGYIWACPPQKGQDYIMYAHPKTQQTPNPMKLRQWYVSMLDKAKEQRVVTNNTNLYDRFFVSTCNSTAAHLPYFEGSFWTYHAELLSKKIESEVKNLVRSLSKRALKGSKSKDADDTKNILLMHELGELISDQKEDLIVVDLHYTCTRCSEYILSRLRWFCKKCKNLQLCQRCHDQEEDLPGEHTHTMNGEEEHSLSRVVMNIPSTTEDNDVSLGNNTFEGRQMFLSFSQKHNYSFDTLRRAKNSSMRILHHLHTSNKLHQSQISSGGLLQVTCTACQKDVSATVYYTSLCCSSYLACTSCYNNKKVLRLLHLFPVLPSKHGIPPRPVGALEILQALLHAHACRITATGSCSYPKCSVVKRLFNHSEVCQKRGEACITCINFGVVIRIHAYHCQDPNCSIPRCSGLKETLTMRGLR